MEEYLAHIQMLLDVLIAVGEIFKQSELVLNVIGELGSEYDPLKTALTSRFDHQMKFVDLQALLMDYEMNHLPETFSTLFVNAISAESSKSNGESKGPCQICGRKGFGA